MKMKILTASAIIFLMVSNVQSHAKKFPWELNKPCSFLDTINITGGVKDKYDNIIFDGVKYMPRYYTEYDYILEYSTTERITVAPHIRGCLCLIEPCVRVCCPPGMITDENEKICVNHPEHEVFVNITNEDQEHELIDIRRHHFGVVNGKPCEFMYVLDPDEYYDDKWYFLKNGSVLVESSGFVYDYTQYCFGNIKFENMSDVSTKLFLCFIENIDIRYQLYPVGMIISVPFLILTLLVYGFIPELRNLHGKSLMCYVFSLIILYVTLSIVQLRDGHIPLAEGVCEFYGYLIYFTVLQCFFWLNVMCYDIWATFKGGYLRERGGSAELKRFAQYCAYAYGFPTLLTLILFIVDRLDFIDDEYKPLIGVDSCFIGMRTSQFIYLYFPISVILIVNIILYSITAYRIFNVQQETKNFQGSSRHSKDTEKDRFFLYLRLFIVMGITWVAESVSFLFDESVVKIIFYVTDVLNCLQGLIIFILFVWKPKVKNLILRRYRPSTSRLTSSRSSRTESSRITSSHIKGPSEKLILT